MNQVTAMRSLTALAFVLVLQGCGKEATPPAAKTAAAPPAATTAAAPPAATTAAPPAAAAAGAGEDVYKKTCAACHDQGVAGAPKLGDKAAWEPRIKQGMDTLYTVGIKGKAGTGMVAKGGNSSLSDADVKASVDYMVAKAR